ncbi:hypothetical protein M9H77_13575 [Catharanthus roseus]|uniref:Uncharacterized protein n=1 Tax=Catharanthus roseus TaxID=4058 RepID=A0ACC0BKT5_CATRO|nr:hypothetical protein M9H77_13575 [Catharanthus roseus]
MEFVAERALKSSFLSDFSSKQSQQLCIDDSSAWVAATAGGGGLNSVACDDFSVDDLLDFSDKDFKDGCFQEDEEKSSLLVSSQHRNSNSSSFSETDDFGSLLAAELVVPADDLENLEWLSQFVDDSQSELSMLCPAGSFKDHKTVVNLPANRSEPGVQKLIGPSFPLPVSRKMRSKRARPNGGRVWSRSPSLTTTETSSISSSSSYGSSSLSPFVWANPVQDFELFSTVEKPPVKKQKKKQQPTADTTTGSQTLRRCSHCQVQKTPQWRTGPMGPKTLCNACGVRYKSGRLFPEYRPACSPTFSQEIHSNSHRKVLEMRRKKEGSTGLVETGFTPMVQSF